MGTHYEKFIWLSFNDLTILWISHKNKHSQYYLKYRCICWKEWIMSWNAIVNWYNKSCWCSLKRMFDDRVNADIWLVVWKLSILSFSHMWYNSSRNMNCICECWKEVALSLKQIYNTKSCICTNKESAISRMEKH